MQTEIPTITTEHTEAPEAPEQVQVRKHNEPQDKEIAELITAARQLIDRVGASEEIARQLAENGYDAERLDEGRALCELAQENFTRRQELMAERMRMSEELADMDVSLYKHFSDFRVVARALFKDSNDRRQLGVSGRRTRDRQRMITTITTASAAASQ